MEIWRKNLYSLWMAQFVAAVGLSMVMPFLPFYLKDLGVTGREAVKLWSGIVFSAPFIVAVFLQPVWGILGDRYGRKPMIVRAMFGLALANALMGFAQSAPQLLALRFFQGSLSGFVAPALALLSSCTPEDRTGRSLGILQSSLVTGMVGGPFLGGALAHVHGYRTIFYSTAALCVLGALIVVRFVKEDFKKQEKIKAARLMRNLRFVVRSGELRFVFLLLVLVQLSVMIVAPFLSLYVESLKVEAGYVALITGLVFGITGAANAVTAPFWGRRADLIGHHRVLRHALWGLALFFVPQAFVTGAFQLLFLRAGVGVFIGGIMPTINTLVHRGTRAEDRGGIYGIFQSGLLIGNVAGPLLGGVLAASLGLRWIFLITAGSLLLTCWWERRLTLQRHLWLQE